MLNGHSSQSTSENYISTLDFENYLAFIGIGPQPFFGGRMIAGQLSIEFAGNYKTGATYIGFESGSGLVTVESDMGASKNAAYNQKLMSEFNAKKHLPVMGNPKGYLGGKLHKLSREVYVLAGHTNDAARMDWSEFLNSYESIDKIASGGKGVEKFLNRLASTGWLDLRSLRLLAYAAYWEYFSLENFWSILLPEGYDTALNDTDRVVAFVKEKTRAWKGDLKLPWS